MWNEMTMVVVCNEAGDYESGPDYETAMERWNENIGGDVVRVVNVTLNVDTKPTTVRAAVPAGAEPVVSVE